MNAAETETALPFQVRAAEPADLEILVEFNCELAWESERLRLDPQRVRMGVTAVLDGRAEARYFVATRSTQVAGQLMLTREWSDWRNGWFYWVQSVYVAPACRRQGAFRQLLLQAREYVAAQEDGVGLRLYVEEHNSPAQETYAQLGFVPTGYRVLELTIRSQLKHESPHV